MALLAPTNRPQTKCEKKTDNLLELIQDDYVPHSIIVENITAEETGDLFKVFGLHFLCLYIYIYIKFNSRYPKKLEATFFYLFRSSHCGCSVKKGVFCKIHRKTNTCVSEFIKK